MIIKKIQIENYLCYYDTKTFELTEGLNIILGENGEGKTKFFEAIDWLFNGTNSELALLVSAKRLHQAEMGEEFRVRVSMTVEQHSEQCTISKSFIAKKEDDSKCSATNYALEGIEVNSRGERIPVDGQTLLERIFPFQIRRYSMFKGESELDIFNNDKALINLINLFSEAKHYEKYAEKGMLFREKAEKAVDESARTDKKNEAALKKLEFDISALEAKRHRYQVFINSSEEQIKKIEENIQEAERHVSNAEVLETLNNRIRKRSEDIAKINSRIDEQYTTALFDENWILVNFEPYHKLFSEKINEASRVRRLQQSEFDKQKGIKEGEKKAKLELFNKAVPLPLGVPSKAHMEEMLHDELCKVCNREAKKGTPEYDYMMERLQSYLNSQVLDEPETEKEKELFEYDYTHRLLNLSINHEDNLKNLRRIKSNVKDAFEFNAARKREIEDLNELLEIDIQEREQLLGNSSLAAEKLSDVLKNYNAWQKDHKGKVQELIDYNKNISEIESELAELQQEKEGIGVKSANAFLIKTRNILRDIETIFKQTKERKFDEFIDKLQTRSNNFFTLINVDSFTGTIEFNKKTKHGASTLEVALKEDGRVFYKPNQSLLTSMHISILFAISDLAAEVKSENFPMIFDAPTSSFGENKTSKFLNLISSTDNQIILLMKDFLHNDPQTNRLSIKDEFKKVKRNKAFWVRLQRPFDANSLTTIDSQIINL